MMIPAPWPDLYRPSARPISVPTNDPAMPSRIVTMMPPGSFPGMTSFAIAPTTSPMMMAQSM
jgi:hypothetical protein